MNIKLKKLLLTFSTAVSMICVSVPVSEAKNVKHNSAQKNNIYQNARKNKPNHAVSKQSNTYILEPARVTNGSVTGFAYYLNGRDRGFNKDLLIAPASTMKVLTATAALIQLGPNYQFKTELLADHGAFQRASRTGVLNSDLVVRFSGAPDLTSEKLLAFLSSNLKDNGIKRIQGKVYIDVSSSVGYDRGNGWPWDDLPLCFSAPASAAVIDHNCVYTNMYLPKGKSSFNEPKLTEFQPIKIKIDAPLVSEQNYSRDACSLQVAPSISNVYQVKGCFSDKVNKTKNYQLDLKFAVQNPNRWSSDIIARMLKKLGIKYEGKIEVYNGESSLPSVAVLPSRSLRSLLDHMLKRSDNLYAEEICKAAARSYYKRPVSITQAAVGIRDILKKRAGINFKGSVINDCSGLSSYNIITPQVVLNVLKFALSNERELGILGLLPISGESGTLRARRSVVQYPLKGNVVAKTGTIRNVRNLAGYVKSDKGNFIPFVVYTTGFSPDAEEVNYMNNNKTLWPNFEFEKRVLSYLYEEKEPVIAK